MCMITREILCAVIRKHVCLCIPFLCVRIKAVIHVKLVIVCDIMRVTSRHLHLWPVCTLLLEQCSVRMNTVYTTTFGMWRAPKHTNTHIQ